MTEDLWNSAMSDAVIVPIYDREITESVVAIPVAPHGVAVCTRVQSMPQKYLGAAAGPCPPESWLKIQAGLRDFLGIESRRTNTPPATPSSPRTDWWPRQNDIHFATNPRIGPDDKLYAVIADNDWNAGPSTAYTAAVRLTSHTKEWRNRWEIPVAGSWVVTGDIYSISYKRFEQSAPRGGYPKAMSIKESAQIAGRQRTTLSLRAGASDK